MDKLNREIIRLSLPAIISNITVPLLGLCDTAISGHLGSELYLAAIAVGTVMLNVVFWMFGFLRGGTTGLTAIAFGSGNDNEVLRVLYRALIISFFAGGLLISLQVPLFSFLKLVAAPGEEITGLVKSYFRIRIWGSPALLATMAISGWFVGMQTTFYPMLIAILMNVVNIILSFLLVFPFGMGFEGVAIGTLISNWVGLIIGIVCVIRIRKGKTFKCNFNLIIRGDLVKYFKVNGNLFIRSFFIICVTMGVTAAGARLGNLTLAVNVIIMQFFQFFSFFMDGFAFAGEALVGLRMGEKNRGILRKSVRRLLQWTFATGVLFSLIYLFGTRMFAGILTDNLAVIDGVSEMLLWISLIPVLSCWAFIYDGFYIGVTSTGRMMESTLIAAIVFFMITFIKYSRNEIGLGVTGNEAIWTGFLSYLTIRGVYLASRWRSTVRKVFSSVIKV